MRVKKLTITILALILLASCVPPVTAQQRTSSQTREPAWAYFGNRSGWVDVNSYKAYLLNGQIGDAIEISPSLTPTRDAVKKVSGLVISSKIITASCEKWIYSGIQGSSYIFQVSRTSVILTPKDVLFQFLFDSFQNARSDVDIAIALDLLCLNSSPNAVSPTMSYIPFSNPRFTLNLYLGSAEITIATFGDGTPKLSLVLPLPR